MMCWLPDGSAYAWLEAPRTLDRRPTTIIDPATVNTEPPAPKPKGRDNADSPIISGVMVKPNTTIETTAKSACRPSSEELRRPAPTGAKLYTTKRLDQGRDPSCAVRASRPRTARYLQAAKLNNKGKISAMKSEAHGKEGNSAGGGACYLYENGNFTAELPLPHHR